jgi:hypothetical protein
MRPRHVGRVSPGAGFISAEMISAVTRRTGADMAPKHAARRLPSMATIERSTRIGIALVSATLLIAGCASLDTRDLAPGVATQADIVGAMGNPTQTLQRPDGEKALYFSKTFLGRQTFVATTGADGRLISLEQVLDYEHMKRIHTGMTADQVKAILGPPSRIVRYAFKPLDVWAYPWRSAGQLRVLSVSVSDDGIVRDVTDTRDRDADGSWKN